MLLTFVRSYIGREWNELEFGDVAAQTMKTPLDRDDDDDPDDEEDDEEDEDEEDEEDT